MLLIIFLFKFGESLIFELNNFDCNIIYYDVIKFTEKKHYIIIFYFQNLRIKQLTNPF